MSEADAVVVDLAEHARSTLAVASAAGVPIWCDLHDYGDAFFAGYLRAHLAGEAAAEWLRQAARAGAACVQSRELAAAAITVALVTSRTDWPAACDN